MAVFTLDLNDDLRAKLEAHRVRLGARSLADAMRLLIDGPATSPVTGRSPKPGAGPRLRRAVVATPKRKVRGFDARTKEPIYE